MRRVRDWCRDRLAAWPVPQAETGRGVEGETLCLFETSLEVLDGLGHLAVEEAPELVAEVGRPLP